MALELETQIMQRIGLGNHYTWYNGSGSCEYIRKDAARLLPDAITVRVNAGDKIAKPDPALMRLATQAASLDKSQYELTLAWQVLGYIIQAHINAAVNGPEDFRRMEKSLRQYYPNLGHTGGYSPLEGYDDI